MVCLTGQPACYIGNENHTMRGNLMPKRVQFKPYGLIAGHWAMVVGGAGYAGKHDDVGLVSLDPVNHPVPECLKQLGSYPTKMYLGGGAALSGGSLHMITTTQMYKCDV